MRLTRPAVVLAMAGLLLGTGAAATAAQPVPTTPPAGMSAPDVATAPPTALPTGLRTDLATALPTDTVPPDDELGTAPPDAPEGAEGENPVTWGFVPSDAEGAEDGRVSFRLRLDPGETVTEHALLTNFSDQAITFTITASDGVVTEQGVFDLLPPGTPPTDVGAWINVQEAVELGPGESVVVPFTLTVPADATPGDHPGGIVAGVLSQSEGAEGPQVGFATRVGIRVHLRVTGEVAPVVTITDVQQRYDWSLNPFQPGELHVTYTVANEGNVRLGSIQQGWVTGVFGLETGRGQGPLGTLLSQQREILPGQSARVSTTMTSAWPLGLLTTSIRSTQETVGDDPDLGLLEPVVVEAQVWAVPWSQLALLLLVVLLVVLVVVRRRRRKARMAKALAAARAEGAAAARSASTATTATTATNDRPVDTAPPASNGGTSPSSNGSTPSDRTATPPSTPPEKAARRGPGTD